MHFKLSAWLLLVSGFLFGITDRSINLLLDDGYYNAVDLVQLFTALFFAFVSAVLYPKSNVED